MTALSDELKPCPFCGGAAALLPRTCDKNTPYNPADRAFPVARCGQCGAEAVGKDWGRPETAASAWNRRALLAAQPAGAWLPTAENINALPEPLRDYVHQLEARCDPSGTVRENAQLKDVNKGLQIMYRNAADAAAQPAVQQPAEDARQEAKDAYVARVAMLRAHAKRAKLVTEDEVLEIASMDADELRRRAIVQRDWHRLFASCLDGLPLAQYSGTPDGCWDPAHIRRVVELLLSGSAIKAQGGKQ